MYDKIDNCNYNKQSCFVTIEENAVKILNVLIFAVNTVITEYILLSF
jgi:hypothetical protein